MEGYAEQQSVELKSKVMGSKEYFRILVFDDHPEILKLLQVVFHARGGYEVFTYTNPAACPIFNHENCSCPDGQSCSDIILTDINMPVIRGIEFIEKQITKGCNCRHLALMSGDFTPEDESRASELGVKFFRKPFKISAVFDWLDQVEKDISPHRRLTECRKLQGMTSLSR